MEVKLRPDGTPEPFQVRDCALVAIATGDSAQSLDEFRGVLRSVHPASIYHHFWGRLLHSQFDEPEYSNDFASWVKHGLHEKTLAERLSAIDPTEYDDIEDLRREILDVVGGRLDEIEALPWARTWQKFFFIRSQIVVFETGLAAEKPEDFINLLPEMSPSSIFYHFIDARRRTDARCDDFSVWIRFFDNGYAHFCDRLAAVDPFFSSLEETRREIMKIFEDHFSGGGQ